MGIFQLRNLVHPLTKPFLQRSWYWTGQISGVDQWAEFMFEMNATNPLAATMICRVITWNREMEVEDMENDLSTAVEELSAMSIGGGGDGA